MKPNKKAITEILSAIAQAQLALGEAERAFQEMVKSMPTCRLRDILRDLPIEGVEKLVVGCWDG